MRRAIFLLIAALICAAPAAAQDCLNNLPCGPVPWRLPQFPPLESPTPFPTLVVTITPTGSGLALTPTLTPGYGAVDIGDHLSTLQALIDATEQAVATDDITALSDAEVSENLSLFFRFTYWLRTFSFGVFTPMIQVLLFFFVTVVLFWVLNLLLPVITALIGVIRKIVQLILDFIPG